MPCVWGGVGVGSQQGPGTHVHPSPPPHQRTDLVLGGTLPALAGEEIGVS